MTKQIVSKTEIATDPALTIVKAFRIANKRAGEAKKAATQPDLNTAQQEELVETYQTYCKKLNALAGKADADHNFKIWVNFNGRTGHTLDRDYKVTAERDNNYELHQSAITASQNAVNGLLNDLEPDDDDDDDSLDISLN